jgi:peptidoglycan L-alanyl-D-glutamate endopeptidase CwlK
MDEFTSILEHVIVENQLDEMNWKQAAAAGLIAASAITHPVDVSAKPAPQPIATASVKQEVKPVVVQDKLAGLKPELVEKIQMLQELAKKENIDFKITCGYRSPEEQTKLYAQGRTTPGKIVTKTKNSRHFKGTAFDVVVLKGDKATWKGADYQRLGALAKSIGLVWGGDWRMRDYCHFELGKV